MRLFRCREPMMRGLGRPDTFEVARWLLRHKPGLRRCSTHTAEPSMAPAAGWGALHDGHEIVLYNTSPKFSATTTNEDTYRSWPIEQRALPPAFPAPPRVKFEGTFALRCMLL